MSLIKNLPKTIDKIEIVRINEKANEIIKLFIDNGISFSDQLKILKMVKEKIEFCRSAGNELTQFKLEL